MRDLCVAIGTVKQGGKPSPEVLWAAAVRPMLARLPVHCDAESYEGDMHQLVQTCPGQALQARPDRVCRALVAVVKSRLLSGFAGRLAQW